ncbi:MAG: hypothetical protein HY525_02400 [Betaproteobacteria bacterium]|nr:hypothetical protein [Betaproteobacteria bacterium]
MKSPAYLAITGENTSPWSRRVVSKAKIDVAQFSQAGSYLDLVNVYPP